MVKYTNFQQPATRLDNRIHLLNILRAVGGHSVMRHTQVHRRTQIALVRNRYDLGWGHSRIKALVKKYEGENQWISS